MVDIDILNIAKSYSKSIRSHHPDAKIYLFGSRLSSASNNESDIDIAVILNDYNNKLDIQLELMKLRREIDSRIEPHPFRKSDFIISNPMANEIIQHGIEI